MRVTTSRFTLAVLAALLLALQLLGPTAPFMSGHGTQASAAQFPEWSTREVVDDRADEVATRGDCEQRAESGVWLRGRDRHRTAAEPDARTFALVARAYETAAPPPAVRAAPCLASGCPTAPSLTSLQIFRC